MSLTGQSGSCTQRRREAGWFQIGSHGRRPWKRSLRPRKTLEVLCAPPWRWHPFQLQKVLWSCQAILHHWVLDRDTLLTFVEKIEVGPKILPDGYITTPGKMPPISKVLKYITNSLGVCILNPFKISLKTGWFQNNLRQFDVHYVKKRHQGRLAWTWPTVTTVTWPPAKPAPSAARWSRDDRGLRAGSAVTQTGRSFQSALPFHFYTISWLES